MTVTHSSLINDPLNPALHNLHSPGYLAADALSRNSITTAQAGDMCFQGDIGNYFFFFNSGWVNLNQDSFNPAGTVFSSITTQGALVEVSDILTGNKTLSGYNLAFTGGNFEVNNTELFWSIGTTAFEVDPTQIYWNNGADLFQVNDSQLSWNNAVDTFVAQHARLFWNNGVGLFTVTQNEVSWGNGTDIFNVGHSQITWDNGTSIFLIQDSNSTINTTGTFTLVATTNLNNAAILFGTQGLLDFPSGGSIGSAATTVDISSSFNILQTTASQTITIPNPTSVTAGRIIYVNNTGTTSFTMLGKVVPIHAGLTAKWDGQIWSLVGFGG
jgi:hypothetical protein